MAYSYSQEDKTNLAWFDKDNTKATLMAIEIAAGRLRGLENLKIQLKYPITAISGRNGTGKSTILACIACAFHNSPSGFKTLNRKNPYYTFSDFFIQTSEEEPLAYLQVRYQILHNAWRKSSRIPTGIGLGWQSRWKLLGRWNNYRSRVHRNVVFCGIERVVPHAEKRDERAACGVLDGDQTLRKAEHVNLFLNAIESVKDREKSTEWIENRLTFLPGSTRPERWLLDTIHNDVADNLAADFGVTKDVLTSFIQEALSATDHTEIYVMTQRLNLSQSAVESRLVRGAIRRSPAEMSTLISFITGFLT